MDDGRHIAKCKTCEINSMVGEMTMTESLALAYRVEYMLKMEIESLNGRLRAANASLSMKESELEAEKAKSEQLANDLTAALVLERMG